MNASSGYIGWSMSRRAEQAYAQGEKPISKFGRADLAELRTRCAQLGVECPVESVVELRELLRTYGQSSWHHTSSRFNRTDFYALAALAGVEAGEEWNVEDLAETMRCWQARKNWRN